MKCGRVRAELSALRDQGLAGANLEGALRGRVEEHLAACAACRAELEAIDRAARAIRRLAPAPLGEAQVESLLARVGCDQAPPVRSEERGLRRAAGYALAFSSGVAASVGGWFAVWTPGAVPGVAREALVQAIEPGGLQDIVERQVPPARARVVRIEQLVVIEHPAPEPVPDPFDVRLAFSALELCRTTVAAACSKRSRRSGAAPGRQEARVAILEPGVDTEVPRAAAPVSWTPPATLRIRREGPALSLVTHGNAGDVFPALIDRLADDDPDVRAIVHDRLDAMRDELEATEEWRSRLAPPNRPAVERMGAGDRDQDPEAGHEDDPDLWRRWWSANETLVVAYEAQRSAL